MQNEPSPLFCLLCAALVFSTRITHTLAQNAAAGIFQRGWTTAEKLASTTWEERVRALNEARYRRYDEQTASYLGEAARKALDDYDGDLRNLRRKADHSPPLERRLLKEFKGIGNVGAEIFCREVQVIWRELLPFADERVTEAARRLGLPASAEELRELAGDDAFPLLAAALVKVGLETDYDAVRATGAGIHSMQGPE